MSKIYGHFHCAEARIPSDSINSWSASSTFSPFILSSRPNQSHNEKMPPTFATEENDWRYFSSATKNDFATTAFSQDCRLPTRILSGSTLFEHPSDFGLETSSVDGNEDDEGVHNATKIQSAEKLQGTKRQFLRTKMCPFAVKGNCSRKFCSYAHSMVRLSQSTF